MAKIYLSEEQMRALIAGELLNEYDAHGADKINPDDPETLIGGFLSFRDENGKNTSLPVDDCEWSDEDHAFRFYNLSDGDSTINIIINPADLARLSHKPYIAPAKMAISTEDGDEWSKGTVKYSSRESFTGFSEFNR